MTSAPLAQQRLLIDLQALDNQLARLRHERRHLPVLGRIETVVERLKTNKRDRVLAATALSEAQEAATRSEEEVDQVARRAGVLRERLSSGAASPRDLTAIQAEIDHLGLRQQDLEERQLVAMETLETARDTAKDLADQEQEIRAAGRELTAERDAEFTRIDAEIASVEARRADLAGSLDQALVGEYEAVRAATGGLGAVALYGRRVEGAAIEISPAEHARIAAAAADAVIHAEESDVIVVRMEA